LESIFPTPAETRAIIEATPTRYRIMLLVTTLTGMRSSEVRGLRWQDVDFGAKLIRITQRIDRYGATGSPKSGAGTRDIPLAAPAVQALREWQLKSGKRDGLVFATNSGKHIERDAIVEHVLKSACRKGWRCNRNRRSEIYRPALPSALLCVMAHKQSRRWWVRTLCQACARALGTFENQHDVGRVWPLVPGWR
jgi:integrase